MAIPTNTSVTIRTRSDGAEDAYGNPAQVWTDTATGVAAFLEQNAEREVTEGQDTAVSDWTAYIDGAAAVGHRDRIVEGSRIFEVVGTPDVKTWPGGTTSHTEVMLRLVI